MLIRNYMSFLMLSVACVMGEVTITEYPLGKQCAVAWTSDDMYDLHKTHPTYYTRWTNFWESANLAVSNHIVFCPAINVGTNRMTAGGFVEIQSGMEAGLLFPMNHSYSHPINITDYELEYIISQRIIESNLTYSARHTYNGQSYNNVFVQWGGSTNIDLSLGTAYAVSNNYIGVRGYNSGATNWPDWNESLGMFATTGYDGMFRLSMSGYGTFTQITNSFDTCYSNRTPWIYMGHAWRDEEDVYGTNTVVWHEIYSHIGNRPDVWYTDLTALMQYRYLATVADLTISKTGTLTQTITVSCNHAQRVKYGLSVPVTYAISVNTTYTFGGYNVFYRDAVDTEWTAMAEVTTNDYFTGANCYLNNGTNVLVSQGLPQTVDSFQLKVVPRNVTTGYF